MAVISDFILRGDRASQPNAGDVDEGTLYHVTDEARLERSDGAAAWDVIAGELGAVLTADPGAPDDDTFWVRRTGASPAMDVELRVRVAGTTYTIASITI